MVALDSVAVAGFDAWDRRFRVLARGVTEGADQLGEPSGPVVAVQDPDRGGEDGNDRSGHGGGCFPATHDDAARGDCGSKDRAGCSPEDSGRLVKGDREPPDPEHDLRSER